MICLQETKVVDDDFPWRPLTALGYGHALIHGMKSYNGVAILSRLPLSEPTCEAWCGKTDCRHAIVLLPDGIELHNVYVPGRWRHPGSEEEPASSPTSSSSSRR